MKYLLFCLTIVFSFAGSATIAQDSICATPEDEHSSQMRVNLRQNASIESYNIVGSPITVNVVFHVYNNCITATNTLDMLINLNTSFSGHNINFIKLCDDFIPAGAGSDPNDLDLPYAVNIYIYPSYGAPRAKGYGSNALYIGKFQSNTSSLPHEMGHCLNLFHTHHQFQCIELIDESNCSSCGDYVCDTPADPGLNRQTTLVDNNCNYIGTVKQNGATYHPDTHNFMSYSNPECRNRFSVQQGKRMYDALKTLSILLPVTKDPAITGSSIVCTTTAYSFKALLTSNISWFTSNPAGLYIDQISGQATRQNNYSGLLAVRASVSGSCGISTLSKTVWVGPPTQPGSVSGEIYPSVGAIYPYVSSAGASGAASYNWTLPYNGNPVWSQSGGNINGIIDTLNPNLIVGSSSGWVQAYGINECGNGAVSKLRVFPVSGGGGGIQRITIYPNPTQKILTIESTSENSSDKKNNFEAKLLNSFDQELTKGASTNGKLDLYIQDLQDGIYYLHVNIDGKIITKHVQIKK